MLLPSACTRCHAVNWHKYSNEAPYINNFTNAPTSTCVRCVSCCPRRLIEWTLCYLCPNLPHRLTDSFKDHNPEVALSWDFDYPPNPWRTAKCMDFIPHFAQFLSQHEDLYTGHTEARISQMYRHFTHIMFDEPKPKKISVKVLAAAKKYKWCFQRNQLIFHPALNFLDL